MKKAEVIVVGAGPAGCAAAFDLLDQGFSVTLLDKAAFPRFKPCAGGLTPKALYRLRYSVAPVIRQTTCEMGVGYKGKRLKVLQASNPVCALTVRTELDEFCFNKTVAKGAQFQQIKGIKSVHQDSNGVALELADGSTIAGDYLIGADGAHSKVRRLTAQFTPDRTAVAFEGIIPRDKIKLPKAGLLPPFTFDFGVVHQGYAWLFPKGDHVNVGLYTRRPEETDQLRKEFLKQYTLEKLGTDEIDHICGFPIGTGGEYYQPTAERVFLVGDAGGFAEPLLGEGLHNAIKSGQAAASAIVGAHTSNRSALELFKEDVYPVARDTYNCRRVAKAYYKVLPMSYQVIKRAPVATIAMNGFAAGLTVTECKKALFRAELNPSRELSDSIVDYNKLTGMAL